MKNFDDLLSRVDRLLEQSSPSAGELRRLSVDLDDLIHSPEFQNLDADQRNAIQKRFQEVRARLRGGEKIEVPLPNLMPPLPNAETRPPSRTHTEERQHNPLAQETMEEAEKLFYGGRYAEAIRLYDQVLTIEPDWDRARQHRSEAENYLRTGHIPAVALPAEAASAFGKAQSAARLGRYQDAMALLMRAQNILQQYGIQRWQEGAEFEQKLQQNIDAENVFNEGLQRFAQGQLDEGIDRVEAAAQATGLPRYTERLQTMLKEREQIQQSIEALNATVLDPRAVAQAKSTLDSLSLKYGQNPILMQLRSQLEVAAPRIAVPLKEQVQSLKTQALRAQTIEAARNRARQARQILDQIRSLGYNGDDLDDLQEEVEKTLTEIARYEDQLEQARSVLDANRTWPAAAARLSADLRARYPNDPGVIELNRALAPYNNTILGLKIGAGLLAVAVLFLLIVLGANQVRAYIISLTPTATPTPTAT
ncbi:hypothetical protein ATHL_02145, partial [Anaerolinea thermolimosa]